MLTVCTTITGWEMAIVSPPDFHAAPLTLKRVKTDIAAFTWLSLKIAVFVETERLSCWHLWCSSTARSDSCRKTHIYVATLGCSKNEMTLRGFPSLNASQMYNEMMRLTATCSATMHAYKTCLDKWDTWQPKAPGCVWGCNWGHLQHQGQQTSHRLDLQ